MTERTRIIIALILLVVLVGTIVFEIQKRSTPEQSTILTPTETIPVMNDASVRSSRSYRLEDNLSIPSARTIEE